MVQHSSALRPGSSLSGRASSRGRSPTRPDRELEPLRTQPRTRAGRDRPDRQRPDRHDRQRRRTHAATPATPGRREPTRRPPDHRAAAPARHHDEPATRPPHTTPGPTARQTPHRPPGPRPPPGPTDRPTAAHDHRAAAESRDRPPPEPRDHPGRAGRTGARPRAATRARGRGTQHASLVARFGPGIRLRLFPAARPNTPRAAGCPTRPTGAESDCRSRPDPPSAESLARLPRASNPAGCGTRPRAGGTLRRPAGRTGPQRRRGEGETAKTPTQAPPSRIPEGPRPQNPGRARLPSTRPARTHTREATAGTNGDGNDGAEPEIQRTLTKDGRSDSARSVKGSELGRAATDDF